MYVVSSETAHSTFLTWPGNKVDLQKYKKYNLQSAHSTYCIIYVMVLKYSPQIYKRSLTLDCRCISYV